MSELKGACIIGQSGGPTSVINASAYGVIRTALDSGCITNVYGAEHGIKGVSLHSQLQGFELRQDSFHMLKNYHHLTHRLCCFSNHQSLYHR